MTPKETISRIACLRAKLQPIVNREVLEELIDIEIKLQNKI